MTQRSASHRQIKKVGRTWPIVLSAAAFFFILAMLPSILPAIHLKISPSVPNSSYGVTLMVAPKQPSEVRVPSPAQPVDPGGAPASMPDADAAREVATVAAEDTRLRAVLHAAQSLYQPEVVTTVGSLPTLVLTAAQGAYTAQTLVEYGAMVMLPDHAALLIDNVYVSDNATLDLGGSDIRTLYMDSDSGGFATIVAWDGNLAFSGTAASPMTIIGWDRSANAPAADAGYGRSYIREVGGKMTLTDVRATALGFWSGRTGGIAWTGLTGAPSTGGAASSTFTGDTYGAFVSRGSGVTFTDDLFEFNQLDGLHVHRYSVNTSATDSAAVRNGGNGFLVSPATEQTTLEHDVSQHNAGDGFYLDGQPLATGASASGGSVTPGTDTDVEYSSSLDNEKSGVLVEGGLDTVVKGDQICGGSSGVEVKDGASDAVVTGNTIACSPGSGIEVGPSAPGTVLSGNAINGARTAILVSSAGSVQLDKNLITNATVFGVSARGASSRVSGVDNTIAGSGFRAVDSRADAPAPSLYGTDTSDWTHHEKVTVLTYLQFHPLAAMWLGIATLLLVAWLWARTRRRPAHPYPHSTRWRPESTPTAAVRAREPEAGPVPGTEPAPEPVPAGFAIRPSPGEGALPVRELAGPSRRNGRTAWDAVGPPGNGNGTHDLHDEPVALGGTDNRRRGLSHPDRGRHPRGISRPPWETMPLPKLDPGQVQDERPSPYTAPGAPRLQESYSRDGERRNDRDRDDGENS